MSELAVLAAPDTTDLENEGNEIVERAEAFIVNGCESYATAGTMMVAFKGVVKKIKGRLDPVVKSANDAHKALTQMRNECTAPYTTAEAALKLKMATWHQLEEARVRREQEAAARERQVAAAKQAADAEALRQANMPEAAEKMIAETPPLPVPVIRSEVPKIVGVSTRKVWKARIVNEAHIKRAYLQPNTKAIDAAAKAMGKLAEEQVGGIEVYEDTIMAGRTG